MTIIDTLDAPSLISAAVDSLCYEIIMKAEERENNVATFEVSWVMTSILSNLV